MKAQLKNAEAVTPEERPRIHNAEIIPFAPNSFDDDDIAPLITPGVYEFVFVKKWTGYLHGRCPKVMLRFRIVTEGPFFGKCVNQWLNVRDIDAKGRIIPKRGNSSKFVRQHWLLFGRPSRARDMGLGAYRGKVLRGEIKTVQHDAKQRLLPEHMYYSVISEIFEVIAGA